MTRYMLVRSRFDGGVEIVLEHPRWFGTDEILAAGSREAVEVAARLIGEYYTPLGEWRWTIGDRP